MIKPSFLLLAAIYVAVPSLAEAFDSQEQQALTLRMCDRVIAEYSDAVVLNKFSKDFKTLELEFARCNEILDGYLLDEK